MARSCIAKCIAIWHIALPYLTHRAPAEILSIDIPIVRRPGATSNSVYVPTYDHHLTLHTRHIVSLQVFDMKDRLLIWGSGSAPCWRVMAALEEKGLDYTSEKIDFSSSTPKESVISDCSQMTCPPLRTACTLQPMRLLIGQPFPLDLISNDGSGRHRFASCLKE